MALAERLIDFLGTAIEELGELFGRLTRGGVATFFMDRRGELKPGAEPAMDAILNNPAVPEELKSLVRDARGDSNPFDWFAYVIMQAGGLLNLIGALGKPAAQSVEGAQWQINPVKLEDPSVLISEYFRGTRGRADVGERMLSMGYDTAATDAMIDTARPLLSLDALRDLELRHAGEASAARRDAMRAGWTEEQLDALRVLYYYIPPPQDLIRMAVREAFSPEIAERFGQFQDFPPAFAQNAAMQGISEEWALRYWAAHWDLPSPMQGFEMLHRGVISDEELDMLLRALDVMPFWRDKLKAIAFRIPTRVDIRRMYKVGAVTREQVKENYIKEGYPEDVAEALTVFTEHYYAADEVIEEDDERVYTKSEILDGYRKRILDADTARELLREMGYQETQVDFYLRREDLKIDQALRDAYLSRYRTLFVEGVIEWGQVVEDLGAVGVTEEELNAELPLWQLDRVTRASGPTKAELKRWVQNGIIDHDTWYSEMRLMGYSDRYIGYYDKEVEVGE